MPKPIDPSLTGRIIEWDDQKGYGFLQIGRDRFFLHRREFAERHKPPAVGDVIRFNLGQDAQGRTCAKNAIHVNDGGRITVRSVLVLLLLLVLPVLALHRRGVNLGGVAVHVVVMGAISYGFYALDKRRAKKKEWRIAEFGLHLTEVFGGWPGAFLAQRHLRHKCSKVSYQIVFWLIVFTYQFVAFDSLQNWHFCRIVWEYVGRK